MRFNRREFLGAAIAAGALAAATKARHVFPRLVTADSPERALHLADDLGWGDLSFYGRPDYRTPNLDRLASEERASRKPNSASPVCHAESLRLHHGSVPRRAHVRLKEPLPLRKQEAGKWA